MNRSGSLMSQYRHVSAEADLLLSMVLLEMDSNPKTVEHISKLIETGSVNWDHFILLALDNEILPTVYPILKDFQTHTIPADALAYLKDRFKRNARRNKVLCQELLRLNELFSSNGIKIINYKGPETVTRIGIDITRRQFNDLDFLIRPEQLPHIRELLSTVGYFIRTETVTIEDKQQKDYSFIRTHASNGQRAIAALPGDSEEYREIIIEPHVSLVEYRLPLAIDYEGIWRRAQPIGFLNTTIPSLSAEDLLFVLCINGCKAKWKNLKLICHIANLIHRLPDIDFDACMIHARKAGCERMLLLGLILASDLLGVNIPPIASLQTKSHKILTRHAKIVVSDRSHLRNKCSWFRHFPARFSPLIMQTLDRRQNRIQYTCRTMTLPRHVHYKRIPLPIWLHGLYRIIVPLHDYLLLPTARIAGIALTRITYLTRNCCSTWKKGNRLR